MTYKLINDLIYNWRIEQKLSQDIVSEYLGMSQSAYSQLENGNRGLMLNEAYRLCKFYKKRLYELYPEHKLELVKSELHFVKEHERTSTLASFRSEITYLKIQNKHLEDLLNSTESLHNALSLALKNRMGIR